MNLWRAGSMCKSVLCVNVSAQFFQERQQRSINNPCFQTTLCSPRVLCFISIFFLFFFNHREVLSVSRSASLQDLEFGGLQAGGHEFEKSVNRQNFYHRAIDLCKMLYNQVKYELSAYTITFQLQANKSLKFAHQELFLSAVFML